MQLMIDANHAYNLQESVALCSDLKEEKIAFFEEPISPELYEKFRELRQKTEIPIASGECEYLRFGFKTLLDAKSVDIIQPDVASCGGITEFKRYYQITKCDFYVSLMQ